MLAEKLIVLAGSSSESFYDLGDVCFAERGMVCNTGDYVATYGIIRLCGRVGAAFVGNPT